MERSIARRIGSSTKKDAMKRRTTSPTMIPTVHSAVFETPLPILRIGLFFGCFAADCPLSGALLFSRGDRSVLIPRPTGAMPVPVERLVDGGEKMAGTGPVLVPGVVGEGVCGGEPAACRVPRPLIAGDDARYAPPAPQAIALAVEPG